MAYANGGNNVYFEDLADGEKIGVLLAQGAPAGSKLDEVAIDGAVNRYLRKARRGDSNAINEDFGRLDVVWTC